MRNLHFLSKNSTLIVDFIWGKTRENVVVLDFLAVDNFDFTRKIVKRKLGEICCGCLGFLAVHNFDFTRKIVKKKIGVKNS